MVVALNQFCDANDKTDGRGELDHKNDPHFFPSDIKTFLCESPWPGHVWLSLSIVTCESGRLAHHSADDMRGWSMWRQLPPGLSKVDNSSLLVWALGKGCEREALPFLPYRAPMGPGTFKFCSILNSQQAARQVLFSNL